MLPFMGSQRVRHDLATEQQQRSLCYTTVSVIHCSPLVVFFSVSIGIQISKDKYKFCLVLYKWWHATVCFACWFFFPPLNAVFWREGIFLLTQRIWHHSLIFSLCGVFYCLVTKSCLTLGNPMDSLQAPGTGSSVHRIF